MRDSQREKVYQAEFALRDLYDTAVRIDSPTVVLDGIPLTLPPEAKFAGIADIQAYCNRVTTRQCVLPVDVRARKGVTKAHYQDGEIAIPDQRVGWAMREIVVLHELAHYIAGPDVRHGPRFVSTFIDLLSTIMGPEVGLAYRLLCNHSGARETV